MKVLRRYSDSSDSISVTSEQIVPLRAIGDATIFKASNTFIRQTVELSSTLAHDLLCLVLSQIRKKTSRQLIYHGTTSDIIEALGRKPTTQDSIKIAKAATQLDEMHILGRTPVKVLKNVKNSREGWYFKIDNDCEHHLLNLSKNFTKINSLLYLHLPAKYRNLYKYLLSICFFKSRRQNVPLSQLRSYLQASPSCTNSELLRKLKQASEAISKYTEIKVVYRIKKQGRTASEIQFHISRKCSEDVIKCQIQAKKAYISKKKVDKRSLGFIKCKTNEKATPSQEKPKATTVRSNSMKVTDMKEVKQSGRMNILYVDPLEIHWDEKDNIRVDYGDLDALADSILARGPQQLIKVRKTVDHLLLEDGYRRVAACRLIKERGLEPPQLPARLVSSDNPTVDRLLNMFVDNDSKPLLPLEEAEAFKRLREEGVTPQEIAKQIGRSVAYVVDRILLLEADDELKALVKDGKIGATLAAQAVKVEKRSSSNKGTQKKVAEAAKKGDKEAAKKAAEKGADGHIHLRKKQVELLQDLIDAAADDACGDRDIGRIEGAVLAMGWEVKDIIDHPKLTMPEAVAEALK